jgi:hypothetical protein
MGIPPLQPADMGEGRVPPRCNPPLGPLVRAPSRGGLTSCRGGAPAPPCVAPGSHSRPSSCSCRLDVVKLTALRRARALLLTQSLRSVPKRNGSLPDMEGELETYASSSPACRPSNARAGSISLRSVRMPGGRRRTRQPSPTSASGPSPPPASQRQSSKKPASNSSPSFLGRRRCDSSYERWKRAGYPPAATCEPAGIPHPRTRSIGGLQRGDTPPSLHHPSYSKLFNAASMSL